MSRLTVNSREGHILGRLWYVIRLILLNRIEVLEEVDLFWFEELGPFEKFPPNKQDRTYTDHGVPKTSEKSQVG